MLIESPLLYHKLKREYLYMFRIHSLQVVDEYNDLKQEKLYYSFIIIISNIFLLKLSIFPTSYIVKIRTNTKRRKGKRG